MSVLCVLFCGGFMSCLRYSQSCVCYPREKFCFKNKRLSLKSYKGGLLQKVMSKLEWKQNGFTEKHHIWKKIFPKTEVHIFPNYVKHGPTLLTVFTDCLCIWDNKCQSYKRRNNQPVTRIAVPEDKFCSSIRMAFCRLGGNVLTSCPSTFFC